MSEVRLITHHVRFKRYYVNPNHPKHRQTITGYLKCTSFEQAQAQAKELAEFVAPPFALNAHVFVDVEIVTL